ncbi:MAG TPA: hypothetical protein VNF07_04555 [Acidimicrobiales bacterium]|nr:hypothetical protein [Acidimicrobiales bacterium]
MPELTIRQAVDSVLAQAHADTPMGQAIASSQVRVTDDIDGHTEILRHLLSMGEATEALLRILALELDDLKAAR